MPTTSNFGWTTPADTDLVKDGAAAIRTLGNGIDTSLVDLKGGTTGQILSKASNTDLDYTWITNDVGDITAVTAGTGISGGGTSGAVTITNSMATEIDAKGDLIVGTGADTFARLAVGTNGYTLVADSSVSPTGLKWAAPAGGGANWSLLNTGGTALTGAATITVSGISAKDKILVQIRAASSSSTNTNIGVRINGDTANNYKQSGGQVVNATESQYNSDFSMIFTGETSTNAASILSGYVFITGCNASGVKAFWATGGATAAGGSGQVFRTGAGIWDNSATVTSISIHDNSGNLDAGNVFVYTSD